MQFLSPKSEGQGQQRRQAPAPAREPDMRALGYEREPLGESDDLPF